MNLEYGNKLSSKEYMKLRESVGWVTFPLEEAENSLNHSFYVVSVRDNATSIGCARVVWDHGYIAFLADVIVDPKYQGFGIGRQLVEKCLNHLKENMKPGYIVKINLMAAKGKENFYKKFGFSTRPNERVGAGMDCIINK